MVILKFTVNIKYVTDLKKFSKATWALAKH